MIFPEGSHDRRRTIRNLSKGFTRILFGAMNKYPDLQINIIPVGVTYQNTSQYPSKVAIHYGKPILANNLYNPDTANASVNALKEAVSSQLQELSVHIPLDENYETSLNELNNSNVDFTNVDEVNAYIKSGKTTLKKQAPNLIKPLYLLLVLNSLIPWTLWKLISRKIDETEFVDTFRFGISISIFPIFYCIQTFIVYQFYGASVAGIYFGISLLIPLLYSKLSTTPTE